MNEFDGVATSFFAFAGGVEIASWFILKIKDDKVTILAHDVRED